MQNRRLAFFFFLWFRVWDFFSLLSPVDSFKLYTCTLCNWRGLFNHPFIAAFEKALSSCSWVDFLQAWSCSHWKCSHFPQGNRIWLQMKSQLHIKSWGMCGLSHKSILFQSSFSWARSQALLSACLICLKNIHLQELASVFEYWLFFFLSHKNLDVFSKQWTRIALPFQCNYKFAPFFPF